MKTLAFMAIAICAMWLTTSNANAQCGYATFYAPPVYQPVVPYYPAATFYAPPAPVVVPTATFYSTRYRPVRGVYRTRVSYGYAPAYYYGW